LASRITTEENLSAEPKGNLRLRAEKFLTAVEGEFDQTSTAIFKNLVLDLKMYQLQLEMQNEELQRAQGIITQARDRYADLYDFAPVGYFTLDRNGKIVEVNLAGAQLLGVERDLLVNRSSFRWVAPESREACRTHYRKVFNHEGRQTCEVKLRRHRGPPFYVALESVAVPGEAGKVLRCRTTMSDITSRKQAEIELKLKERLLDGASDSIFLHDFAGNFIYVNEAACRDRGYKREELRGKDVWTLIAPDYVATREKLLQDLKAQGEMTFVSAHVRKDGSMMPVEIHARIIDLGDRSLILSVARDITERQRASKEIARLASFPQLNPNPVLEVDSAGNVTFTNPAALETAWKLGLQDAKPLLPADLREILQATAQKGERQFYREVEVKGRMFAAHIHFAPQFRVTRLFLLDITKRKQAEAEVKLNEARLASLLRISQYPSTSIQELLDYALDEAIALTGSRIGYIYFYDETTQQFTLNTWSKGVMKQCTIVEPQDIYHLEKTGLWGETVRQAIPIVVNDFQQPHPLKKGYPPGHAKLDKFLTVPVFFQGRIVAVAAVANKPTDYDAADVKQLTLMMEVVWKIVDRQRAAEKLRLAAFTWRTTFDAIGDALALLDREGNIQQCNQAMAALVGKPITEIIGRRCYEVVHGTEAPIDDCPMGRMRQSRKREELLLPVGGNWFKVTVDPILDDAGKVTGAVHLVADITQLKQAEAQVQHSLEKIKKALNGTVLAVANTMEMRDPYTAGHQRQVAQLAGAIAQEMGLSPERVEGMRVLGCLHDIGKIAIPAEILSKPGRLSPMEFTLIQDHPRVGYEILKDIDFPFPLAEGILQHHERLNGSGYPLGISGPDIILEAKILAVADVMEAVASDRPYRKALGIDQAMEEISQNRGILYDPEVVDICKKLFIEKGFSF
jgi:PAS domain S-box-containing protein/putative nucleotidyltransferase with HDIG domain